MKFKVGDRVKVAPNGIVGHTSKWKGSLGTVSYAADNGDCVQVRLDTVPSGWADLHERMDGLWCKANCVKRLHNERRKNEVQSPCELRCAFVGNATTMSLVDADGKVECTATARCHPNDKWDIGTGMALAFDRLYNKYREQNPNHSAPMVGDSVRLKKGALLPPIINWGSGDTPAKVIYNEVGTVKDVSPNAEIVTVEWSHNVVAVVAASDLERCSHELKEPLWHKGQILITRANGYFVRVTKDYYHGDDKVEFETSRGEHGTLTADKFSGGIYDDNRIKVGDVVEAIDYGVRTRGIVTDVKPMNKCSWMNSIRINGVDGSTEVSRIYREDRVRPLEQREAFVGETVYVLNEGFSHIHLSERKVLGERVNAGIFCKVVERGNWLGGDAFRVEYRGVDTYVNPRYMLVLDK